MRSSLNRQRRWIVAALVASASLPVAAQTVETKPTDAAPAINLGGTPSVDLITLRATSPSSPLRYGNVIVGSERVQLDGRILSSSTDYAMDYESGVVYLKVPQKAGSVKRAPSRGLSAYPSPNRTQAGPCAPQCGPGYRQHPQTHG